MGNYLTKRGQLKYSLIEWNEIWHEIAYSTTIRKVIWGQQAQMTFFHIFQQNPTTNIVQFPSSPPKMSRFVALTYSRKNRSHFGYQGAIGKLMGSLWAASSARALSPCMCFP
jgi:hypothetical protein